MAWLPGPGSGFFTELWLDVAGALVMRWYSWGCRIWSQWSSLTWLASRCWLPECFLNNAVGVSWTERFWRLWWKCRSLSDLTVEVKHCSFWSAIGYIGEPWLYTKENLVVFLFRRVLDFILRGSWSSLESARSFWSLFLSFTMLLWWV